MVECYHDTISFSWNHRANRKRGRNHCKSVYKKQIPLLLFAIVLVFILKTVLYLSPSIYRSLSLLFALLTFHWSLANTAASVRCSTDVVHMLMSSMIRSKQQVGQLVEKWLISRLPDGLHLISRLFGASALPPKLPEQFTQRIEKSLPDWLHTHTQETCERHPATPLSPAQTPDRDVHLLRAIIRKLACTDSLSSLSESQQYQKNKSVV